MTKQIRGLGVFFLVCFLVLFIQLNRLTVFEAAELRDNPINTREVLRDFASPRGSITSADGALLARSVPSNDRFKLQRQYPEHDLFAHIVGFFSLNIGASGVEREYNEELAGRTLDIQLNEVSDLFVEHERVGNVTLTVRKDVQEVARRELGNRKGSVVALDPRSGAILAMWSFPAYDPNFLAAHNTELAAKAATELDAHPDKPRLAKAYQDRFFPGSTFKVVTATAGVERAGITESRPSFPVSRAYTPPLTNRPIRNFGGTSCGGTLFQILRVSCNTAFAEMGVRIGGDDMVAIAERFGFNRDVPIDLPNPAKSNIPTDFERNTPALAQSAIGQNDVSATPLQMAMVAAAVANGGTIMKPHVLDEVRDSDGNVVDTYKPESWTRPMSGDHATLLRRAMLEVVARGTATGLQMQGMEVGGKTGTAQLGTDPPRSHAWIIGFAGPPGEPAQVAVAVLVEGQPGASEQTGGRVAAPIARAVMEAVLRRG